MNMVTIKEDKDINISSKIKNFLNPDYVYIPIPNNYKICVNTNDNIYKEDILLSSNIDNIYSPVSGKIIGESNNLTIFNKNVKCLVIENNYEEKLRNNRPATKYINKYDKDEFLGLITKYKACEEDFTSKYKNLLINGIDPDPYEKTRSFIIDAYSDKLLETIDAIRTIFKINNTYLCINNNDTNNVINLSSNIGTYPNIKLKLMPDIYPLGFREILIKNALSKREINDGVLVINIEDIYNIYNVLKRKKPISEKLVTISGNVIEQPLVVNAKIGTSMADLIKNTCKVTDDKYYVIVNGLISGITLNSLNSIYTNDIRSIFLNTKDESVESECINCGLCNEKCPMHLNPKYLITHKKADKSKCIHCGLCTYLCPAKINFKKHLGGRDE